MNEQEEEKKDGELNNDDQSESGSESKEDRVFSKVHEMDLERQRYYNPWNWKPCKVRIFPDSASIFIDNDDYFKEYAKTDNILPLNKCTISVRTDTFDNGNKIILYLELLYKDQDITLKTLFRLPHNKMDTDAFKFTLFAATLRFYGSQFEELQTALKDWDKQRLRKKTFTKSQIIAIFKKKFQYDLFEGLNEMNKYVQIIESMDEMVIKPLQNVLKLDEFSKKQLEQWKERCKKALDIEYEWKMLSSRMKIELDKIHQISKYTESSQVDRQIVEQYEKIQSILRTLSAEMGAFYQEFIIPEITAWQEIVNEYKDSKDCHDDGVWKMVIGGILIISGIGIAFLLCPPVAVVSGAAASGAATGAAATTAAISTAGWFGIGAGIVASAGGIGLLGYGAMQCWNSRSDYKMYVEADHVWVLWKQFKETYLEICQDVNYIQRKDVGLGPGSKWNHDIINLIKGNSMELGEKSFQCISKIDKLC